MADRNEVEARLKMEIAKRPMDFLSDLGAQKFVEKDGRVLTLIDHKEDGPTLIILNRRSGNYAVFPIDQDMLNQAPDVPGN